MKRNNFTIQTAVNNDLPIFVGLKTGEVIHGNTVRPAGLVSIEIKGNVFMGPLSEHVKYIRQDFPSREDTLLSLIEGIEVKLSEIAWTAIAPRSRE